ncbi:MAG: FHA domain-containing protein [Acinetobacter sp.]|nr:FHA domain-containing protein [Acinetobacter sp.]
MTWKLQAITGEFTGQEISVERDMLVGRHQDAEILLQSTDISRKHAALLFRDDHIWVKDLKSTNGTFVNGERVEQEQEIELHDGDMLQFASFMFMILAPERYKAHLPEIDVEPVTTVPHDQGMPSIAERAAETGITRDGMPQQVSIPKPAPIPENVQVEAVAEPKPVPMQEPFSRVAQEKEQQKNASVGLISIIILVILAVIAWLFFK